MIILHVAVFLYTETIWKLEAQNNFTPPPQKKRNEKQH